VEEVGVDERGEEVVRRGDGVNIAGEVEIDLLAGLDLRESAAGGAAFHAEDGAEGGFAGGDDGFFAETLEALHEADGGDRFAFAGGGGGGGGDEDELAARQTGWVMEDVEMELGVPGAELVIVGVTETELMGDGGDGEQGYFGGGRFESVSHLLFSQREGVEVAGNSTLVTNVRIRY
jgi:hypothetical protein